METADVILKAGRHLVSLPKPPPLAPPSPPPAGAVGVAGGAAFVVAFGLVAIAFTYVLTSRLLKAQDELIASEDRANRQKLYLDSLMENVWRTGRLSREQYLDYLKTGNPYYVGPETLDKANATKSDVQNSAPSSSHKGNGQRLKAITKKHNDAADKLAAELNALGVKAKHSGNYTIKDSSGKSIRGTEGTATTRKPDVVAETESGQFNTGIEMKTSEEPETVQKAVDQLQNEFSFEGKGYIDGKPWTIGEGSGVVYAPYGLIHICKINPYSN